MEWCGPAVVIKISRDVDPYRCGKLVGIDTNTKKGIVLTTRWKKIIKIDAKLTRRVWRKKPDSEEAYLPRNTNATLIWKANACSQCPWQPALSGTAATGVGKFVWLKFSRTKFVRVQFCPKKTFKKESIHRKICRFSRNLGTKREKIINRCKKMKMFRCNIYTNFSPTDLLPLELPSPQWSPQQRSPAQRALWRGEGMRWVSAVRKLHNIRTRRSWCLKGAAVWSDGKPRREKRPPPRVR